MTDAGERKPDASRRQDDRSTPGIYRRVGAMRVRSGDDRCDGHVTNRQVLQSGFIFLLQRRPQQEYEGRSRHGSSYLGRRHLPTSGPSRRFPFAFWGETRAGHGSHGVCGGNSRQAGHRPRELLMSNCSSGSGRWRVRRLTARRFSTARSRWGASAPPSGSAPMGEFRWISQYLS